MKHIITTILFSIVFLFSHAQDTVFLNEIEFQLPKESSYFEGFYSILTEDSIFLGGVYAITYYDPCNNYVALCLPNNSEIPQYWLYLFKVNDIQENEISNYLSMCSDNIFYTVIDDNEYFYVTLKFIHNNNTIIYYGIFEIEDELD